MSKLLESELGHWKYVACLNYSPLDGDSVLYIDGYQEATKILVDYIRNKKIDQDLLIYPIVFLSRHCIELELKEIIKIGKKTLDEDFEYSGLAGHDINKLSEKTKHILLKIDKLNNNQECCGEYKKVEQIVKEISDLDSSSTTFRYNRDISGNKTKKPNYINIIGFYEEIKNIHYSLNIIISYLGILLDCAEDMREEYRE
ncbi:MAG: hypothetical protein HQ536_00500 [Parcubacteria group bacterium]|nr:hypothetical protein [Parcubacteria group bacterium]